MTDQAMLEKRKQIWNITYGTAFANFIGNNVAFSWYKRKEIVLAAHNHAIEVAQEAVEQISIYLDTVQRDENLSI